METAVKKTLIACVVTALVVGGGTATAAQLITGDDVKNGSLTNADIKNESLTHRDVENESLVSGDIRDGAVRNKDLSRWVQKRLDRRVRTGAAGPQGPAGPKGADGQDGAPGYESIGPPMAPWKVDTDPANREVGFHDITVNCPPGKVAISGGVEATNNQMMQLVTVHGSHPAAIDPVDPDARIWHAKAWEVEFSIAPYAPEPAAVQAFALCQDDGL
jgi:hypothetical protein